VRKWIYAFLAVSGLGAASITFAQTPASPVPLPSVPPPTVAPAQSVPAIPPYGTQKTTAPGSAPPVKAQPPVSLEAPESPETPVRGYKPYTLPKPAATVVPDRFGSAYIPDDSWINPALVRLYSMGFVNTMYLGMRPWTRRSVLHMLQKSQADIIASNNEQAQQILAKLLEELSTEVPDNSVSRGLVYGMDSSYTRLMGISGPILQDSFHLGQTINNDYGRPYQSGFNNITGASTTDEWGPFSLYVRGEYQHAPSADGYSLALAEQLSAIDQIPYVGPQPTIPVGPISAENPFRLVEASVSAHLLGHEISGGKTDAWLGPATGSSMAWSNNAENIYSFRVNRVEPLNIRYLSRLLGPVRYDFFVGSLKGHTYPRSPWVHAEMFSFRPTDNFEFGFERTVIWGGEGHTPVTLHTFLNSFFDTNDTDPSEKYSRDDPGARFSDFNFSYRLPLMRKYTTFYVDSIVHDDVTPISAPRRSSYRTGLYVSQIPGLNKLDFRVEAVSTDPGVAPANNGEFAYWETVQRQGYTNKGFIMGDWIGREAKGGQAWITYHLSANEFVQLEYLNKKTPFNFIPGGTTQNEFKVTAVKRLGKDLELNAWVQYEGWKAPVYKPGLQKDTAVVAQFTWYPKLHTYPQH
jgi:hypothetical protein